MTDSANTILARRAELLRKMHLRQLSKEEAAELHDMLSREYHWYIEHNQKTDTFMYQSTIVKLEQMLYNK